jgi:hypothetical protein
LVIFHALPGNQKGIQADGGAASQTYTVQLKNLIGVLIRPVNHVPSIRADLKINHTPPKGHESAQFLIRGRL